MSSHSCWIHGPPQKKFGSTKDGSKTPHLLPVSVTVSVTVAKRTPDAVRRVMTWALFNAFVFVVSYAMGYAIDYALHHYHVSCNQFSLLLRCDQLTDAERTHWIMILCCAAFLAAAAALVLWLPGRRRWVLRALAYLALVLTVVGHCMFFVAVCLNHAAVPGLLVCWIFCTIAIVFYAVGDIISFLAHLRGGED